MRSVRELSYVASDGGHVEGALKLHPFLDPLRRAYMLDGSGMVDMFVDVHARIVAFLFRVADECPLSEVPGDALMLAISGCDEFYFSLSRGRGPRGNAVRYSCFEVWNERTERYGYMIGCGGAEISLRGLYYSFYVLSMLCNCTDSECATGADGGYGTSAFGFDQEASVVAYSVFDPRVERPSFEAMYGLEL